MNTSAVDSLSQTTYKLTPITAVLGVQMLFVAFGALVLVPLLTGLDPNVALFTAGVGTLLFQLVTRGQVQTIPTPVMGGILIILFGAIVVVGLNLLVKAGQDLLEPRNLTIVALVLVTGVGGLSVGTADWALKGIGLAGIMGVAANLLLPGRVSPKGHS